MKSEADLYVTDTVRRWRGNMEQFVGEMFGANCDPWQSEACGLASNEATRRIALKACKGPGKTAWLAWFIYWFLVCFYEAKVGCTSITEANLDTNLWPELYKWRSRSRYISASYEWTRTLVQRKGNPNWFAVKRTWPRSGDQQQQADALAGIHADSVAFVLDESGGIPQAVMVTAEAVLANVIKAGCRAIVAQAGNPTHTSGPLHRACVHDRALWNVVTINGDPDDPNRSPRISMDYAREEIAKYGRDNPWVMCNVLGLFPPASINALLGIEEVIAARGRRADPDLYTHVQKRLGVDVARFGDDRTVCFPRQGIMSWKPIVMRNLKTTTIAARVAHATGNFTKTGTKDVLIIVDDTGHWGHGVLDNLQAGRYNAIPVIYSDPAPSLRYKNMRSYQYIKAAEWVRGGGCLPPSLVELDRELTEQTYTFLGGAIVMEEKDQVKARLGYSPDLADGFCNTFALPDVPADIARELGTDRARRDFDPYPNETDGGGIGRAVVDRDPYPLD